jgi:hypothetical protein
VVTACGLKKLINMHYTIGKDPNIDAKVERDQEYINSHVLDLLGNHVHSILLCGGFGRGEGTVKVSGNEIHVVNDYDITIVLKERNKLKFAMLYQKYHTPLEALAVKLAKDLQMKQIDMVLKHFSYFEKPSALKIENYEVKKGSVLTYGDEDPALFMPDWRAENIPLFEGTWLFRNRGAGMLIPALYFMRTGGIPDEKRENFVIECNKAQLAMGDSILLLKQRYHHLYSERLRCLDELEISEVPEGEIILKNYQEALVQKLKPDFERFYRRNLVAWWFQIVDLMNRFYRLYESKRLGVIFNNWIEYSDLSKPEDRYEIKAVVSSTLRNLTHMSTGLLKKSYNKARKSYSVSIVPLLLFSIQKNGFNLPYMEKASKMMDIHLTGNEREIWLNSVRNFLHELHPSGEVANAINL